ncbi:MAG: CBS domain-containing protein [Chromatiales bacterium]|nr:CBS domain-containing protein [Chromatiales bacterium]
MQLKIDNRMRWSKPYISLLKSLLFKKSTDLPTALELIKQADDNQLLNAYTLPMIKGIFNVSKMHVREVMVPRSKMIYISYKSKLEDIVDTVISSGHSRFPIIEDDLDDIRGILLAKDLLSVLKDQQDDLHLDDYIRQPALIPDSKRLNILLTEFRKNRNHMAVVVDEYGGVCGLVTIEDVLEQIVGDISDEHDIQHEHYIYNHGDRNYTVQASTPIDYFNRYFTVKIRSKEITIGGTVTERLGHIPGQDESIEIEGLLLRVSKTNTRRVEMLEVKKIS